MWNKHASIPLYRADCNGRASWNVAHRASSCFVPCMELSRILAENVTRLRKERGASQDALAYEAKVARRYIARIEGGTAVVGLGVLQKLATALDVQPYELLMRPKKKVK
jgi:ribosome-binding protein aMBF1 (putative translation factor)